MKPLNTILRYAMLSMIVVLACLVMMFLYAFAVNNWVGEPPGNQQLEDSLESSVVWLEDNHDEILAVDNPILWYFLHRAAEISADQRIANIVKLYLQQYVEPNLQFNRTRHTLWAGMFDPSLKTTPLNFEQINQFNYYSQHFAYAINCDPEIGQLANIQVQNQADFCGAGHWLAPTCTTHQLMGIRFLQRSRCEDPIAVEETITALQRMIRREISLDPRVLDVYIQRAMILLESGGRELVNDIWIRRVLSAQHTDGGWGNFQPLVRLPNDTYLGFGYGESRTGDPRRGKTYFKVIGTGKAQSTFHATAQGVLLLTLLLHGDHEPDSRL